MNFVETARIGVESIPSTLRFDDEPPVSVSINEIFSFTIGAEIRSGSRLGNARIICEVTKYFE